MSERAHQAQYYALLIVGCLFILSLALTAPSQEDIDTCVKKMGWSESRCKVELNR